MNVLYHIDNEAKWPMTLENVKNMLTYGQENHTNFTIEIVANGIAVMGLSAHVTEKSKLYLEMNHLATQNHVIFAACHNALKKFDLTQHDMCSFVTVVPAGVVEIANKHSEGYCYIKA